MAFVLGEDGEICLRPVLYLDLDALQGVAGVLDRPLPWSMLREIARENHLRGDWDVF